jgi:hypothetical protein
MSGDKVNSEETALTAQLEGLLRKLQSDWLTCTNYWRDQRVRMLDNEVFLPIQTSGQEIANAFDEFMSILEEARAEVTSFDLPDFRASEDELNERIDEAKNVWGDLPGIERRDFSKDFGLFAHVRRAQEIQEYETDRGRLRNVHYGLEYELLHPDGRKVRYDYVDLEAHRIIDYKPLGEAETDEHIAKKYKDQRQRHIDAYVARFGVVPDYLYVTYSSSTNLDQERASNPDSMTLNNKN